jgi:hypothetical protein
VVVLALISGAEFAILKLNNAEYRAELARLTFKNKELERKVADISRINNVKEGLK